MSACRHWSRHPRISYALDHETSIQRDPSVTRPFMADDLYDLTSPGEPQFAPAGSALIYVVGGLDRRTDSYRADLYLRPIDEGPERLLVRGHGRLRRPSFEPDGERIAYIDAAPGERPQIWLFDPSVGEAERLTGDGDVSDLSWSPDGGTIAYCALAAGVEPRKRKIREFTRIPVAVDGIGVLEPQGPSLFLLDVATKRVRMLAAGEFTYRLPVWSPDGRDIAATRLRHYSLALLGGGELLLISPESGEVRVLASDVNWQQPPAIAWAPDSTALAYCTSDPHLSGVRPYVVQMRRDGLERSNLTTQHDRFPSQGVVTDTRPGAGATGISYSPDGQWVYYTAGDRGSVPLFRCATDGSGRWGQVTPASPHCVAEFCVSKSGRIAFVSQTETESDQIWTVIGEDPPRRLTDTAGKFWSQFTKSPMRRFAVRAGSGAEADAWIQTPEQGSPPFPAILSIHGGPHGMFGYCLLTDVQGWLDEGWAVIQVNPPGSAGYGFDFARTVWGDWGGVDYGYQIAAVDHCVERGWVDADRLAVTGTSYGGFMVSTIVTRTDRFRCAVSENAPSDLVSGFLTSDLGLTYERHIGGVPWRDVEKFRALSPLSSVAKVATPILILAAEDDRRQPVSQSEEWFTALLVEGKDAVLVRYPYESHFMRLNGRPSAREHRLRRVRSWFREHLESPAR